MKIHEFQAKKILSEFEVPVQQGEIATDAVQARAIFEKLATKLAVVKAQVHAGGRGKAGGVKLVRSAEEAFQVTQTIMGRPLVSPQTGPEGVPVNKVLLAAAVDIASEYYLAIVIDRNSGPIIMASAEGGVEIEEVARRSPEKIFREQIDVDAGLLNFQARRMAYRLGFAGSHAAQFCKVAQGLASAFLAYDCSLAEINPLVVTKQGELVAVDAKMAFDDNAGFRHQIYQEFRDDSETHPAEIRAKKHNLSYIRLDGNIGCMVNGAGLAMATMDLIKVAGGEPANFLDVGGGVSEQAVTEAFKIILSDSRVQAILVNIFGGIVHCDVIAQGIVHAVKEIAMQVPLVVCMEGTNVEKGRKILDSSGLDIITADELQQAADKTVAAVKQQGAAR